MNRRAQRPTSKCDATLRVAVALLLAVFVFVSFAHWPGSAAEDEFTTHTDVAAAQPDLGVIRHSSNGAHCRVLDVAVTRTLKFPSPFPLLPSSEIWRTETTIATPNGHIFQLFRPPKAVPEQA